MQQQSFYMKILGRTIEHLGTQMYKHRAPTIAELVANCWDAGANNIQIFIPDETEYNYLTSKVVVLDDGEGMDISGVQNRYLVVGRNRRSEDNGTSHGRKVMGRKGIGKLAGFGLAEQVVITTWTNSMDHAIQFSMSLNQLKVSAGDVRDINFPWTKLSKQDDWPPSGTRIELSQLRHTSPIDIPALMETLSRRFSRTTRGEMIITVNGSPLSEPSLELMYQFPEGKSYEETELPGGKKIRYRYQFSQKPVHSKELQGFVIYANERTAQAPPFFFNVEAIASAQHSARYVSGEILADYLDEGVDDESDVISTDRQELDWEKEELSELRVWGQEFTRKLFRECAALRGKKLENWIIADEEFSERLRLIDPVIRAEISKFLKVLGQKYDEEDERTRELANSLIRAYEFRAFHDVIDDIEQAGEDPEKLEETLGRLYDWKVLESRAILEIVRGRLSIINKLEKMIIHNAPETASSKTYDNLHDLLAEYPWIFNPEWQVFAEERTISKQLKEWGIEDCPQDIAEKRIDFLAFAKEGDDLIIIELKRPGHAVSLEELQRLEKYQVSLMLSRSKCRRVLVYGGAVNIPTGKWADMIEADDFDALSWADMFKRAKTFYSHYEAILDGDVTSPHFLKKSIELARTKEILLKDLTHRAKSDRERGVGDVNA